MLYLCVNICKRGGGVNYMKLLFLASVITVVLSVFLVDLSFVF